MAELQAMGKPNWTNNCPQLADNFTSGILDKHGYMDEIRIVFERYDIQRSLKQTTRNITQGTHILAVVPITHKNEHSQGSHENDRCCHMPTQRRRLAAILLKRCCFKHVQQRIIVAWGTQCQAIAGPCTQARAVPAQ